MRTEEPRPIRLRDYRPPDWLIETVELDVSLDPTATTVRSKLRVKPNGGATPAPLVLDGEELKLRSLALDGKPLPARSLHGDAGQAHHRAAAEPGVHARDRDRDRSGGQHPADGTLPRRLHLLHTVRGRGFPPHYLFPRPARRDGGLHHAHRGRQKRSAGPSLQRQSDRQGRRARHQPAFRGLARSVQEALLSVRAGRRRACLRRRQLSHHVRARCYAPHLCGARQRGPLPLRHGQPQARHALGRGGCSAANTISIFS